MEDKQACELEDGIEVPESALLRVERPDRYGSVAGLDDEELAGVDELERQVCVEAWGPIWQLPQEPRQWRPQPTIDQEGHLDWGAFGTVDFDRLRPTFNKARYKADRLQEELRYQVAMMAVVQERLSPQERFEVIEAIHKGVDDPDYFDGDKWFYARRFLRARRLRREIQALREFAPYCPPTRRRW